MDLFMIKIDAGEPKCYFDLASCFYFSDQFYFLTPFPKSLKNYYSRNFTIKAC